MSLKKNHSFNDSFDSVLLSKKLLNKTFYHKSYVRSTLLNNKKLKIIDHYNTSSSIDIENLKLYTNNQILKYDGMSLNSKMYTFTNLLNNSIKFNTPTYSFVGEKLNYLQSFETTLASLNQNDNNFREILILNPIKGGFQCYFSGAFGFLPRSQANIFFYDLANNFIHTLKQNTSLIGLNLFKNIIDIQKRFIFRFPLKLGKVAIYPEHKKNNFAIKKGFKKRIFYNSLNVVFLAQCEDLDN